MAEAPSSSIENCAFKGPIKPNDVRHTADARVLRKTYASQIARLERIVVMIENVTSEESPRLRTLPSSIIEDLLAVETQHVV